MLFTLISINTDLGLILHLLRTNTAFKGGNPVAYSVGSVAFTLRMWVLFPLMFYV